MALTMIWPSSPRVGGCLLLVLAETRGGAAVVAIIADICLQNAPTSKNELRCTTADTSPQAIGRGFQGYMGTYRTQLHHRAVEEKAEASTGWVVAFTSQSSYHRADAYDVGGRRSKPLSGAKATKLVLHLHHRAG
jgi:hypothetical protein